MANVYYPEGTPIYLHYNYTLNRYPDRRGDKYVHIFVGDGTKDPSIAGLNVAKVGRDMFLKTPYAPPFATSPTGISGSGFTARWTLPTGITQAKFFLFTDASLTTIHPEYNGVLVSGTSLDVSVTTGGTLLYALASMVQGKPVSVIGNAQVVSTTVTTILQKATAMGLTAVNINDAAAYVDSSAPGLVGTYTKDQTGLYSTSADLSTLITAGCYKDDLSSFALHSLADNQALSLFLSYKLTNLAGAKRYAAFGNMTSGVNCGVTFGSTDITGADLRVYIRNDGSGTIFDQTITGKRDLNTHLIFLQIRKIAPNFELKLFMRDAGGSAGQVGTTTTAAIGAHTLTVNVMSFMRWEKFTPSGEATGKVQYGGWKAGAACLDADIIDLLNTGTLQ